MKVVHLWEEWADWKRFKGIAYIPEVCGTGKSIKECIWTDGGGYAHGLVKESDII